MPGQAWAPFDFLPWLFVGAESVPTFTFGFVVGEVQVSMSQ